MTLMNLQGNPSEDEAHTKEELDKLCDKWDLIDDSVPKCKEALPEMFKACDDFGKKQGEIIANKLKATGVPVAGEEAAGSGAETAGAETEEQKAETQAAIKKEIATCRQQIETEVLGKPWFVPSKNEECSAGYEPGKETDYLGKGKDNASFTFHRNSDQDLCETLMDQCYKPHTEEGEPVGSFYGCRSMSEWVSNISYITTDDLIKRGKDWCRNVFAGSETATQKDQCEKDVNLAFCVKPIKDEAGETCGTELSDEEKKEGPPWLTKEKERGNKLCMAAFFSPYLRGRWQTKDVKGAKGWEAIDGNAANDVRACFGAAFNFLREQEWFKSMNVDFAKTELQAELKCKGTFAKDENDPPEKSAEIMQKCIADFFEKEAKAAAEQAST